MGWSKQMGLDRRFMFFVVSTMSLSTGFTILLWSLGQLFRGDTEGAVASVWLGLIGVGIVFVPMLAIGLVPSLLAFALVYRATGGENALPLSAEYAGVITAGTASLLWALGLWYVSGDGAEIIVGSVGIAAVLLAPFIARWAYRPIKARNRTFGTEEIWTGS